MGDVNRSKDDVMKLGDTLLAEVHADDNMFLEIDKPFSKVLQLGLYRVVIVYAPLVDTMEITAVRPVKKMSLADYALPADLLEHIRNKAQGILVSGAPGEGKTTFAQALAEQYVKDNKIVKTLESPRDLVVPDAVSQYSFNYASHDEMRDILLLSRPDHAIYDEVRNAEDFVLYADLRLTGIGLVGVTHATKPVDSIQRFIGHVDMGSLPQVIDTVIFIRAGQVSEVLTLEQVVKMPAGMASQDLARPVLQVSSFDTKKVLYEIYSFGEQIVVMELSKIKQ
ncbi:MAG: ATPase, T2SS/T4P/T4SS family [bacterium]